MIIKIKVLLHVCSNINQNPNNIVEAADSFAGFVILPQKGNYREIKYFPEKIEVIKPNDIFTAMANISFQEVADKITNYFKCPGVYVLHPKITTHGLMVTYSRGELERNMLFLKIDFEEPI